MGMRGMRALRLVLAVVIAVFALRAVPAYSSHGGVMIPTLAIDPLTPTTLYAGEDGSGVFKSTDGGASWSSALLFYYGLCGPCGGVGALTIDPLSQTTLFGGTGVITAYDYDGSFLYTASGRVFKSTDGGTGWGMLAWLDDDES